MGAVLSPLWLAVMVLAGCGRRLNARWPFFVGGLLVWWVMPLDSRFLLPLVPAALLAALPAWRERFLAVPLLTAAALLAPVCLRDAAHASFRQYDTLPPALGLRAWETHLKLGLTPKPDYWQSVVEVNRLTRPRARLLFLAGIKSYYINRRCRVPHQHIDPAPLLRELRQADSPRRLAIRFRQQGVTHLLYMTRLMGGVPDVPETRMTEAEARRYVEWFRHSSAYAFRWGEVFLYTLRPGETPRPLGRLPMLEEFALKELTDGPVTGAVDRLGRLAPESSSYAMVRGLRVLLDPARDASAALDPLAVAIRHPEASAIAWRAYGFALDRTGETGRALMCYRRAIDLLPADPEVHYNLGQLLSRLGRWPEAAGELATAVRLDPGRQEFRRARQDLQRRMSMLQ